MVSVVRATRWALSCTLACLLAFKPLSRSSLLRARVVGCFLVIRECESTRFLRTDPGGSVRYCGCDWGGGGSRRHGSAHSWRYDGEELRIKTENWNLLDAYANASHPALIKPLRLLPACPQVLPRGGNASRAGHHRGPGRGRIEGMRGAILEFRANASLRWPVTAPQALCALPVTAPTICKRKQKGTQSRRESDAKQQKSPPAEMSYSRHLCRLRIFDNTPEAVCFLPLVCGSFLAARRVICSHTHCT